MLQLTEIKNGWQPQGTVVKADEFQALREADALLAGARHEVEQMKQHADAEFQRQSEAGYQQGLEDGRKAAAAESLATAQQLTAHIRELEGQLAELIISGVERIVGECDVRQRVLQQVSKGLEQLAGESKVTVLVCPEEAAHVNAEADSLREKQIGLEVIEIVPDPRLEAGKCILQTEWNVVDTGVEIQLEALREALTDELTRPANNETSDTVEESNDGH